MENNWNGADDFREGFLRGAEGFQTQQSTGMAFPDQSQDTTSVAPAFPRNSQQIGSGYHFSADETTPSHALASNRFYNPCDSILANQSLHQHDGNHCFPSSYNIPHIQQPSGAMLNSLEHLIMPINGPRPLGGSYHNLGYAVAQNVNSLQYPMANPVHQQNNEIPCSQMPNSSNTEFLISVYRHIQRASDETLDAQRDSKSKKRQREELGSFTPPRMRSRKRRTNDLRDLSEPAGLMQGPTLQQDDVRQNEIQSAVDTLSRVRRANGLGEYGSAQNHLGSMPAQKNDSMIAMSPYSALAKNSRGSTYPKITFEPPCTPHNFKHPRRVSDPMLDKSLATSQKFRSGRSIQPKTPAVASLIPDPCSAPHSSTFVSHSAVQNTTPNLGPISPASWELMGSTMPTRSVSQDIDKYPPSLRYYSSGPQPSTPNQDSIDKSCAKIQSEQPNTSTLLIERDTPYITANQSGLVLSNTTSHHDRLHEASIPPEIPDDIPPSGDVSVGSSTVGEGYLNTPGDAVPSSVIGGKLAVAEPHLLGVHNSQSSEPNMIEEASDYFGASDRDDFESLFLMDSIGAGLL